MLSDMDIRMLKDHRKGLVYFCREDMVELLLELGAGEETDTRNRIEKLAFALQRMGNEPKSDWNPLR